MKNTQRVNDFVVRFTNVNGTGSASANNLFAKAVFRMGIPVSPKNIFPSNIQGLPTWYEVRINENGYLGRRDGVDFTVAINGKTLKKDYDDVSPGGYFLYDSTRSLPETFRRRDITSIGVPLTILANGAFETARLQQLLKNIIYVGALAYFIDLDINVVIDSLKEQFKKKPKVAEPNIKALELGFEYAKEHFGPICHLHLEKRQNLIGNSILVDGNSAVGLGAVFAGATVAGWYPITPSTSVVEAFEKYCHKFRIEDGKKKFAILQAEDELAACGIVIGASWNGARAFTATSGPGLSLMSEFLGLAYFAEIPAVLVDVQRAGPSTGMPTRTQQSDVLAAAYASHGDTKQIVLFPSSPKECFDLTIKAFDLAERLQTPVIILSDLDLGMNDHMSAPFSWSGGRFDRGKVLNHDDLNKIKQKWGRYLDMDGDGICYRTLPGTHPEKGAYFTRGTSHNAFSGYTEDNDTYKEGMDRLLRKWETGRALMPKPTTEYAETSEYGILFYGTSNHSCKEALDILKTADLEMSFQQIYSFPFHEETQDFLDKHKKVFVVEQNRDGQLRRLLLDDCTVSVEKLISVLQYDGMPISADFIMREIKLHLNGESI